MRKIYDILFKKRDNQTYLTAQDKLCLIKKILEEHPPKIIKYKEIYVTEVHF